MTCKNDEYALNLSEQLKCYITSSLMVDPVIVSTGHTYERYGIEEWFNSGYMSCPKTKKPVTNVLLPNITVKSITHEFVKNYNNQISSKYIRDLCLQYEKDLEIHPLETDLEKRRKEWVVAEAKQAEFYKQSSIERERIIIENESPLQRHEIEKQLEDSDKRREMNEMLILERQLKQDKKSKRLAHVIAIKSLAKPK